MTTGMKKLVFMGAFSLAAVGLLQADAWDKKTTITTDEAVQLPNMVLQPGTYVIKLANLASERHIVQFFDKGEAHLITTILAIPNERVRPTGKTVFAFWEVPAGQPKALRAWFYPGDNFGQEFAYPKEEAARITANNPGAKVPVSDEKANDLAAAVPANNTTSGSSIAAVNQQATPPPVAAPASAVPPAPVQTAAAVPQQAPRPAASRSETQSPATADTSSDAQRVNPAPLPDSLPKTASNLPFFALIGLLSAGAALGLNFIYRRS
jgi:hypothetical protein